MESLREKKTGGPFTYDKNGNPKILSRQFFLVLLVSFLIRMCQQLQNTSLPLFIQNILGGSTAEAGVLVSVFMTSALVARLFIGRLVDKRGRKPIMIGGIAVFGITVIAFGFIKSMPMLYVLRAIQGIGFAGLTTAISTSITDMTPESRLSQGIGYYGLTQSLTQAIGPVAIIFIIGNYGYDNIFNIFAAFAIGSLILACTVNVEKFRVAKLEQRKQSGIVFENIATTVPPPLAQPKGKFIGFVGKFIEPRSVLPALCASFIGIATTSVGTFLPTYGLSLGLDGIGAAFTVQAGAIAVSRIFAGKISARYGSSRVVLPAAIMIALSLVAMSFATTLPAFMAIAAVYGLSFGALQPEINSITITRAPFERRGIASSTYFNFLDLGNAVGASLWGFMSAAFGLKYIFAFAAVSLVFVLLIYFKVDSEKKVKLPASASGK